MNKNRGVRPVFTFLFISCKFLCEKITMTNERKMMKMRK